MPARNTFPSQAPCCTGTGHATCIQLHSTFSSCVSVMRKNQAHRSEAGRAAGRQPVQAGLVVQRRVHGDRHAAPGVVCHLLRRACARYQALRRGSWQPIARSMDRRGRHHRRSCSRRLCPRPVRPRACVQPRQAVRGPAQCTMQLKHGCRNIQQLPACASVLARSRRLHTLLRYDGPVAGCCGYR